MPLVLATDLDGTFLGGTAQERASLYAWIAEIRAHITLIYVTGRGLRFVEELAQRLPAAARPDHVVANVGTTAATGRHYEALEPVESWLTAQWHADAPARIDEIIAAHPHLSPQPNVEGRRKSYYVSDLSLAEEAKRDVEQAGFDALISDNVYFDVLPRGVQKGPTLLRVLHALDVSHEDVLVAGDTLNDLSLFETGLRGVAVANSEVGLKRAVQALPNVTLSEGQGTAGILEQLRVFASQSRHANTLRRAL